MRIIVIGAGAAGMMAAVTAARAGADVTLIERNTRPGMKLNITGKGRGNLTNDCDLQTLIANTPGNGRFLYSAFSGFGPADTLAFFESLGIPVKVERGNRVFPVSDRAMDLSAALERELCHLGVRLLHDKVVNIDCTDGRVTGVTGAGGTYACDRVILAAGGQSYPRTGSDGSGYALASALGHTIVPTRPSLVPLLGGGDVPKRLEGLSLRNISIEITYKGKSLYTDFGEMVFTANGVSGPVILSASAHVARDQKFPCTLSIDLKPALDEQTLDRRVLRDFEENHNRDFANALHKLLPSKLIPVIVERSGIAPDRKVHEITRAERLSFVHLIKHFTLEITSAGPFREAIITAGGVSVREIDPKTMASKLVNGLYFAGEIMDVDAYTGGFNLQIAWSTGVRAGSAAAERND